MAKLRRAVKRFIHLHAIHNQLQLALVSPQPAKARSDDTIHILTQTKTRHEPQDVREIARSHFPNFPRLNHRNNSGLFTNGTRVDAGNVNLDARKLS